MDYRHFEILVEDMDDDEAATMKWLMDDWMFKNGFRGSVSVWPETDADYRPWNVIRWHLVQIWAELKSVDWLPGPWATLALWLAVMVALLVAG